MINKKKGWDCNVSGCPGMAHPCTRLTLWQAQDRFSRGEYGLAVTSAFALECKRLERNIQALKDELLETYRKVDRR